MRENNFVMTNLPTDKKIILFDGICNLCNSFVLKVIKYDKHNIFMFTSLQSNIGKKIINHINIDTSKIDSIILYDTNTEKHHIKSSAILKIANNFEGIWKLTQCFYIIPHSLRDKIYDFIAKNRYKWFGKKEQCAIPSPELTSKFLS